MTRPTKVVFGETTLKKHGDFEPEFLKNRLLSGASTEEFDSRHRVIEFELVGVCYPLLNRVDY